MSIYNALKGSRQYVSDLIYAIYGKLRLMEQTRNHGNGRTTW